MNKKLNEILSLTEDIPYMGEDQAHELSRIIRKYKVENMCELGTFHGKGTICAAAIMEQRGKGHVTTFDTEQTINSLSINVDTLAKRFKLSHRITSVVAEKSHSWELAKLIEDNAEPIFDCVYIDSSHDYAGTALPFYLSNELAKPGCIFIFDDIEWTAEKSESAWYYDDIMSKEEKKLRSVNMFIEHAIRQQHLQEIPTTFPNWRVLHKSYLKFSDLVPKFLKFSPKKDL